MADIINGEESVNRVVPLNDALRMAIEHHKAGELEAAEKIYRAILIAQPDHPDTLHNLGVLLALSERQAEAIPLLKAALMAKPAEGQYWLSYAETLLAVNQPDEAHFVMQEGRKHGLSGAKADALDVRIEPLWAVHPDLATLSYLEKSARYAEMEDEALAQIARLGRIPLLVQKLGIALLRQREFTEALPCFEEACERLPDDVNLWNQRALALSKLDRFDESHAFYLKALDIDSDAVAIYANIGDNLNSAGRFDEAEIWLKKALEKEPDSVAVRVNLANALVELQREEDALNLLTPLLADDQVAVEALNSAGLIFHRLGELDHAINVLDRLLTRKPDYAPALVCKGNVLQDLGRFTAAESLFQEALHSDPGNVEAWSSLAYVRKMGENDSTWIKKAGNMIAGANLNVRQESALRYAMGKYYDDICEYPEAFLNYQRANEFKKKNSTPYDRNNQERVAAQLIHIYTSEVVQQFRAGASASMRPLFIVGQPRSGTSLIEQILASHPAVFGAGEMTLWTSLFQRYKKPILFAQFDRSMLETLSHESLACLNTYSTDALRVVDKMPSNFIILGFIHAVFPNARIIHTMRNPLDTCLSIYFQNFHTVHKYANDLDDIAHYYRQYHSLMAHWRKVLPSEVFLDLPYEALIEDQERWSRRIIEFIGLEWDDQCLEFYKADRAVSTASNWQVRQPIYKSSRERWRNYEKFIGPLLPLLELHNTVDIAV